MRRPVHLAVAAAAAILSSPVWAMGAGGYGSLNTMPTIASDDTAIAIRLIKHQDYARAIPHLEAALAKHPRDADILNYLGYTHRMVGVTEAGEPRDTDFKMSLDYYQQALAIKPDHRGVHEYLGELYLQMGNLNAAHDEMDKLVALCPDGCDERDALGKALAAYVPPDAASSPPGAPAPVP